MNSHALKRQRWSARKAAQRAISLDGQKCSKCGTMDNLQRHHPDHTKKTDIMIMCQTCHTAEEMAAGKWGRGVIPIANCVICKKPFQPKRRRRAKLCGNPECRMAMGRRSSLIRWNSE